jgi:hypothetical protein
MRNIIMALATLILLTGSALAVDIEQPQGFQGSYWYVIDHVVDVDPDAKVTLLAVVPGDHDHQSVKVTNIIPTPERVVTDPVHGNKIVIWKVKPVAGEEQIFFRVDFTGKVSGQSTVVDASRVKATSRDSDVWRDYTRAENWIETSGAVASQAQEIIGNETNPYHQARAIYDWMIATLEFVPGGTENRGAAGTLGDLRGDCGQYSLLFTAMCRSLDIPARMVTNIWFDGGLHRYAEFHVEPYGWIPVDASAAQALVPEHSLFDATDRKAFRLLRGIKSDDPGWLFGNLYSNHMTLTVGNNIVIPAEAGRTASVYTALEPGGADAWPEAIHIDGLNDDVIHGGFFVFDKAINEEQAHQTIHQKLANQFFNVGLVDAVEEGCLMAQQSYTDGVMTWVNMGRVNLYKKKFTSAEACFLRAINQATADRVEKLESKVWAHNYLGNCYDLMGRRERALAEYKKVVELDIDFRGALAYAQQYLAKPFTE